MKVRSIRTIWMSMVIAALASGCSDTTGPEGDAPDLPPQSSFVMDFSDFSQPAQTAAAMSPAGAAVGTYWTRSAFVVGVWSLVVAGTLAPPVAAFVASFSQDPEWIDDAWVWSYDFMVLAVPHSARLEARFVTDGVQWDMYITREGGFTDFHWYTGFSHASGTTGTWSLRQGPDNPTPFIDIEWNRAADGQTWDITYTNVVTGTDGFGSYITHGVTGLDPYEAYYDLFGAQEQNLTEIEWNRTTKEGRTRDPAHFQDSEWRCWDANLDNVTCQ